MRPSYSVNSIWIEAHGKFVKSETKLEYGIWTFVRNGAKWKMTQERQRRKELPRESLTLNERIDKDS